MDYKPTAFAKNVMDMLTYKRPHGSKSEAAFIKRFIKPVMDEHVSWSDEYGNMYIDLRTSPKHRTLFTSHTDIVHRVPGRQKVVNKRGVLTTVDGECLGADDGAGIAILLHMIKHNVPALYVFPRNEEHGGVGARHIADKHANLLADFDRAVAFDRRADWSVITHQGWGRCASDEFAEALADALSNDHLMYAPDNSGVYTDTAEFTEFIPECTNISTFYLNEHTKQEQLDVVGLEHLAEAVVGVDWDALPVERDPADDAYVSQYEHAYGVGLGWREPEGAHISRDDVDAAADFLYELGVNIDAMDLTDAEVECVLAAALVVNECRSEALCEIVEDLIQVKLVLRPLIHGELVCDWAVACVVGGGPLVASAALAGALAVADVTKQDTRTTH